MFSGKIAGDVSRRAALRGIVAIAGACLLTGCSTAHWRASKTAPGYVPPAHFTLVLKFGSKLDADADDGGNVSAMIDSLTEELASRGIGLSPGELNTKAYPRLTLTILKSHKNDAAAPAWNPGMIVMCEVVLAEGSAPSFIGEVRGALVGSVSDSTTSGESIGRTIAEGISEPAALD